MPATFAFYIPLWFNIILFMMGLTLSISSLYFLIVRVYPWFVNLPLLAYGIHISIFYGMITFSQLTNHLLNNETMTLWSAILRFQGISTALIMVFILYLTFGIKKCRNE